MQSEINILKVIIYVLFLKREYGSMLVMRTKPRCGKPCTWQFMMVELHKNWKSLVYLTFLRLIYFSNGRTPQ